LARGRRALVVYGDSHLQAQTAPERSLVRILETSGAVFSPSPAFADLTTFQPDVASWPAPSLALLKNCYRRGPYEHFFGPRRRWSSSARIRGSRITSTPCSHWGPLRRCASRRHAAMRGPA
jgi:hypothetical protein